MKAALIQGTRNPMKGLKENTIPHLHPLLKDSTHSVMCCVHMGRGGREVFISFCPRVGLFTVLYIFS